MANETAGEGALQKPTQPPTFQDVIMNLQRYWAEPGLRRAAALRLRGGRGHVPHRHHAARARARSRGAPAYAQPCRRPADGRYGENPNRMQHYYQFQVLIKPSPDNVPGAVPGLACAAIGIDPRRSTTCASWRTTGKARRWAPGAWAGRSGSTAWRSPSSPTSSRWAASRSTPFPSRSPTAWSAWPCTSRASTPSTTSCGASVPDGTAYHLRRRVPARTSASSPPTTSRWPTRSPVAREVRPTTRRECHRVPGGRAAACPPTTACMKCSHAFNLLDARGAISATERMPTTSCACAPSRRRAAQAYLEHVVEQAPPAPPTGTPRRIAAPAAEEGKEA